MGPKRKVVKSEKAKVDKTPKSITKPVKVDKIDKAEKVKTDKQVNDSIITEKIITSISTNQQLVELINSLVNTKQDEIFSEYKSEVKNQLESDHELILSLQKELEVKQALIDKLENNSTSRINLSYQSPDAIFESPIRKRSQSSFINLDQLSKELENVGFSLDMMELLTGLRIMNYQEDKSKHYFDVKQTSKGVFINYQLVISKNIDKSEDIQYEPTFMEVLSDDFHQDPNDSISEVDLVRNAKRLKKMLPDYLCENLSFPSDTLVQFYNKMSRALNKMTK